jgi:hypothetical protein
MPWLTWIDDADLKREVMSLLTIAKSAQEHSLKHFGKNVIDPFAALFEIFGFGMDYETWLKSEASRQAQKTLQNHIGDFHQNILGCSKNDFTPDIDINKFGWSNMKVGSIIDLASDKYMAIAEIKNKYK